MGHANVIHFPAPSFTLTLSLLNSHHWHMDGTIHPILPPLPARRLERVKSKVYLGDKTPSPQTQATSPSTSSEPKYDALKMASRCHGNSWVSIFPTNSFSFTLQLPVSVAASHSPSTLPLSRPVPIQIVIDHISIASRMSPLAFIFLGITELNGGNPNVLNYVMAALFAFRVAHADGGLRLQGKWGGGGIGHPLVCFGTNGVLLGLGGYAAWLVK